MLLPCSAILLALTGSSFYSWTWKHRRGKKSINKMRASFLLIKNSFFHGFLNSLNMIFILRVVASASCCECLQAVREGPFPVSFRREAGHCTLQGSGNPSQPPPPGQTALSSLCPALHPPPLLRALNYLRTGSTALNLSAPHPPPSPESFLWAHSKPSFGVRRLHASIWC